MAFIRSGHSRSWPRFAAMAAILFSLAHGPQVLAAVPTDPQVVAMERLQRLSTIPLRVDFFGGTPRTASFDVAAVGTGPVAQARNFLTEYADLVLRLADPKLGGGPRVRPAVELRPRGVWDTDGGRVVGFYQTIGGVPVFAGDVFVALIDNPLAGPRVVGLHGSLLPSTWANLDVVPAMSAEQATAVAAADLGRDSSRHVGDPRLMVYSEAMAREAGSPRLVWAVGIAGGAPWEVLVDAHTGEVAFKHPLSDESSGLEDYDLDLEDANQNNIEDTGCFDPTTADDWIGDEDGIIDAYMSDADATNVWWHIRNTYLYYHDHLGRHSWDDDDDEVVAYVHSNIGTNQGGYKHGCGMEFSDAKIGFDITAHEFTHGVIRSSPSNLSNSNQSGALNESFGDIMASMADPQLDYSMGEDQLNGLGVFRSLSDPKFGLCGPPGATFPCDHPDRMPLYDSSLGRHKNAGIPNKAAYLMVEGGSFNGITVGDGMWRGKFERLAYYVLQYVPTQATFADARSLYLSTAIAWANNGTNSFTAQDVCAVRNAWAAVEVGREHKDEDCDGIEDAVDDSDGDGILHDDDNCPNHPNPAQEDWDFDNVGNVCDTDSDGDGCPNGQDLCPFFYSGPCWGPWPELDYDDDSLGPACDPDDDNDGVDDYFDNCPYDPNPDQFDGNNDGWGDACDPDLDGDGFYVLEDNCTFVFNPDQADADADGLGDVCDGCPDTPNNNNAYTFGIPELGIDPRPFQPDRDGDGDPDACDLLNFGYLGLLLDAAPFNDANGLRPDGRERAIEIIGAGDFRVPLDVCSGEDRDVIAASERVEVTVDGLEDGAPISFWLSDGLDSRLESLGRGDDSRRGFRFHPDCRKSYFLHGRVDQKLGGARLTIAVGVVPAGDDNPWSSPFPREKTTAPPPLADSDLDGITNQRDNCRGVFNPEQTDTDSDGAGDVCDDVPVAIDVRPGVFPNDIQLGSKGRIDVAILSSDGFDAGTVKPESVHFADAGPAGSKGRISSSDADVNGDGRRDLTLQFEIQDLHLDARSVFAELRGDTRDGIGFRGFDQVRIVKATGRK